MQRPSYFVIVPMALNLFGPLAMAEKSVYSFGGSCVSQGSWTQAALQHTQTMIETIDALSKDPNCASLQQIAVDLKALNGELTADPADRGRVERFESIPKNLEALRSAQSDPSIDANAVDQVALNEAVEGASLAVSAASTIGNVAGGPEVAALKTALTLGQRTRRAALRGISVLNRLTSALPTYTRCAQNKNNLAQVGSLLAATIQMSGAYSGSEASVHGEAASVMKNIVSMLKVSPFDKAIRTLNDAQYQMSMSCLLETTTQNFCNADDARRINRLQMRELLNVMDPAKKADSPMEGLFLLTRDVPNIASWLKRVQFGFVPRLTSDADFKSKIWTDYSNNFIASWQIKGRFNEDLSFFLKQPGLATKQQVLFQTLQSMVSLLNGSSMSQSGKNFFQMVVPVSKIPFYLIGRAEAPAAVVPNNDGKFVMNWSDWMVGNGDYANVPEFKTPDALILTMEKNLDTLLDEAAKQASIYLMNFLIVDNPNLVSEVVADQNVRVIRSLQRVYRYLSRLDARILTNVKKGTIDPLNTDFNTDLLVMRPAVSETAGKIKALLESLGALMNLAVQKPEEAGLTPQEYQKKVNELYKQTTQIAFSEFNVQFQRETLLSTRLGNFVRADFANRIHDRQSLSKDDRELLISYGRDMLDRLMQIGGYNGDTAIAFNVENDLDSAQRVNLANLVAYEQMFKTPIYKSIQEMNKIITVGPSEVSSRNAVQEFKQKYGSARNYNPFDFYLWKWLPEIGAWSARRMNGLRFESPFHDIMGTDDTAGSIAKFRARLCLQTLAFMDKAYFRDICGGAQLTSVFDELDPTHRLNANYDQLYKSFTSEDRSTRARLSWWRSDRGANANTNKVGANACAWRDYNRRNIVFWLTKSLRAEEERSL